MRKFRIKNSPDKFEIIVPTGDSEETPIYDDCEFCQEIKKRWERGELEEVYENGKEKRPSRAD